MVRLRLRLEIIEILRHLACVHPVYKWLGFNAEPTSDVDVHKKT